MPRSGGGTYTLPAGSTAVSGATIESGKYNTALGDIADGLTDSLSKSGNGAATGDISMGGHSLTNLGAITLGSNDGGALGAAAKSWSDLFLASGGVINWNNGNYTVTHTAGELAFNGIVTLPNAGLHILDTDASHDLIVKPGSNLTADRILTVATGDAARTLTISADTVLNGTITGPPAGRLTLTTAVPVLATDVTSATTVYYTPYLGIMVPLYDGTNTTMTSIGAELSVALDSASGHTGYHQSGKNFDFFIFSDAGTVRLVSGPAWSSDTARATALEYKNGFLCNAASMTARFGSSSGNTLTVAQDLGLYVGTVRMSADGTTKWVANPSAAAGGGNCQLLVWNAYNRVPVGAASKDSTDSWAYTTATWRAANNSTSNRITFVLGLNEDAIQSDYHAAAGNANASAYCGVGVGLDSTTAWTGIPGPVGRPAASDGIGAIATYLGQPGIGAHYVQALEIGGTSTGTFFGDNGTPLNIQMALTMTARM